MKSDGRFGGGTWQSRAGGDSRWWTQAKKLLVNAAEYDYDLFRRHVVGGRCGLRSSRDACHDAVRSLYPGRIA